MSKHAVLGASSASRWLACPGSVRLSEGVPRISSKYADEGTAAHELAERCLKSDDNARDRLGTVIAVNGETYTVTEEMADAVQVYLDVVRQTYAEAGKSADMRFEARFNLDWLYPGMYGRNDAMVGESFGTLTIFDYKHGAGVPVEVEGNAQMMYYALGAARDDAYEDVEMVIVQPRANHTDGPVRRHRITIKELMEWGEKVLLPGAKATEDPNAPLREGSHCRFCPALPVCPQQKALTVAVAKDVFSARPKAPPAPSALSVPELRKVLEAADLIEAWLKASREHVRGMLEAGIVKSDEVGYKLVTGRATRSWMDEAMAKEWLEALLDQEAYTEPKLISPAQAEKILKGAEAKKAIKGMVQETRGIQMAPLSDPREEILRVDDMVTPYIKEVDAC